MTCRPDETALTAAVARAFAASEALDEAKRVRVAGRSEIDSGDARTTGRNTAKETRRTRVKK